MSIPYWHIFSSIGTNYVLNKRLVWWKDIAWVLSRSRHIKILISDFVVHAEMELRVFSKLLFSFLFFWRVLKIEIALNIVGVRSRFIEMLLALNSGSCSNSHALFDVIYIFDIWILTWAYISLNNRVVVSIQSLFGNRLGPLNFETGTVHKHHVNISCETVDICSRAWYFSTFSWLKSSFFLFKLDLIHVLGSWRQSNLGSSLEQCKKPAGWLV